MGALGKDAFLAHAGKLAEEAAHVVGMGEVLCRELDGASRNLALGALIALEGAKPDLNRYQEILLEKGLVDPASPAEAREPLLDIATVKDAMRIGGGKLGVILRKIEHLSGLDKEASKSAEGNSGTTPSSSTTSE